MSTRSSKQTYLLCAAGFVVGLVLLIVLAGSAVVLGAVPFGLSIGIALRTWWTAHGWNPGITVVEDRPVDETPDDRERS
jgi:ammonia channel protein AmtB